MDKDYPTWMYGPGGESRIFERGDVIPKGWKDHPEKVKETAASKRTLTLHAGDDEGGDGKKPEDTNDADTEAERIAAIAELRAAGAEISDDATVEEINAAIDKLTSQES